METLALIALAKQIRRSFSPAELDTIESHLQPFADDQNPVADLYQSVREAQAMNNRRNSR